MWGTDPIRLLDCTDVEWVIRMACAKVIEQDRVAAEKNAGI